MDQILSPYHYLIVDDFGNYRTSLMTMLTEAGVPPRRIDAVGSGEAALSLLEKNRYDVVLCDFNLGEGKDGQQILEESRALGILGYSTIFIMITAETARTMVLSVVENRPDDYLTKPFSRSVLSGRVKRLIAEKEGLEKVDQALEKKSHKLAIHQLEQMIESRPDHPLELMRIKAEILEKTRHYNQAMAIYQEVLQQRPLLWAQLGQGRILFDQQKYAEAVTCFEQVLEENDAHNVARDWMAKALMAMGDGEQAQQILEDAVNQSPRVLRRQKLLATVAESNGDMETAQQAYERTVRLGEHSLFRDISDFTGLSNVMMEQKSSQKALKVLRQAKKSFAGDSSAMVETALQENLAHTKLGRPMEAEKALQQAGGYFQNRNGVVDTETALKLANRVSEANQQQAAAGANATGLSAKLNATAGQKKQDENKDLVKQILSEVTQHNHDNEQVQQQIDTLVNETGLDEGERQLLDMVRQEVINLNNQGVSFYREGKIAEAVEILYQAAERLQGNRVINLNAAQAIIGLMVQRGPDEVLIAQADACLSRIPFEAQNEKYEKLHDLFEQFASRLD